MLLDISAHLNQKEVEKEAHLMILNVVVRGMVTNLRNDCVSKGNKCGLNCTCDLPRCINKSLGYGDDGNSSANDSDVSLVMNEPSYQSCRLKI